MGRRIGPVERAGQSPIFQYLKSEAETEMRFSMLEISGSRQGTGAYNYESIIMERGASTLWKNSFESEYEMVSIMNNVLARQKGVRDIRHVLSSVRGGEHYFFDVDLTPDQEVNAVRWGHSESGRNVVDLI